MYLLMENSKIVQETVRMYFFWGDEVLTQVRLPNLGYSTWKSNTLKSFVKKLELQYVLYIEPQSLSIQRMLLSYLEK